MTKIALVTGASSGIGKACALALLHDGWKVVLVGRRTDALQETVAAAGAQGANAHAIPTDLSREGDVKALFEQVRMQFGRLDLLFNNAGISLPYTLPGDMLGDEWRRAVDINLNGAFYALSYAFKLMQEQSPQGGRIINNGSISAHVPRPGSIAYTATKHASCIPRWSPLRYCRGPDRHRQRRVRHDAAHGAGGAPGRRQHQARAAHGHVGRRGHLHDHGPPALVGQHPFHDGDGDQHAFCGPRLTGQTCAARPRWVRCAAD